ncbi:MAG: endo-1,4-beta-xylanase [Fibrobacteraceae bacterium]
MLKLKTKIFPVVLLAGFGMIFSQTIPSGTALSDNGLLIGATAEVGSSSKEGLFDWSSPEKVQTVMQREFGLVQTTAYPAWDTWGGSGMNDVTFDLTNPNRVINWAKAQGKKVAVHLLAGSGNYFPTWLQEGTGSWAEADLDTLLHHWIAAVMQSNNNATKVDYWNVVNEAFMWNGNYWANKTTDANPDKCPWQDMGWESDKSGLTGTAQVYTQHPKYIRRAFEIARQYTSAKLELRDYGIEFWDGSKKSRAFYQLVKHLLNSGVPLDAVGFQGHFRTDRTYNWDNLNLAIKQYKDLGLEVYITEIDYGDADPIAAATSAHRTAAYDSIQSKNLYEFAKAAASAGVNWLCMWGIADNSNQYWRMGQSALLFDEDYNAKDAYYQFRQGIVDGLGITALPRTTKNINNRESANIKDGIIYLTGKQDGTISLMDTFGAIRAEVPLTSGKGIVPKLPHGSYIWSLKGSRTAHGVLLLE